MLDLMDTIKYNIQWELNSYIFHINDSFYDYFKNSSHANIRVKLNTVEQGCGTFCKLYPDTNSIYINIDVDDVVDYAKINNIKVSYAAKLLCSHELFHVFLGHLSEKYKNHNKKILNIAGDLEINSIIGLKHPGIVPSDFNLPELFTTDFYYEKLMESATPQKTTKMSISMPSDSKSSSEDNQGMSNTGTSSPDEQEDQDENSSEENNVENNSSEGDTSEEDTSKENTEDNNDTKNSNKEEYNEEDLNINLPNGAFVNDKTFTENEGVSFGGNTEYSTGRTAIDIIDIIKKAIKINKEEYKNWSLKGLDTIINKLTREEKAVSIQNHGRINTYYKLNNRRKSDFLLPGKKLVGEGTRKKHNTGLTCFIDVSGSTMGTVYTDLIGIAQSLHSEGATIVYYSTHINLIVKPEDPFCTVSCGGGTNIVQTIGEYIAENDLKRAYVFTDGEDVFNEMGTVSTKYKVYVIFNNKIKEAFNERNPQPYNFNWRDFWRSM